MLKFLKYVSIYVQKIDNICTKICIYKIENTAQKFFILYYYVLKGNKYQQNNKPNQIHNKVDTSKKFLYFCSNLTKN